MLTLDTTSRAAERGFTMIELLVVIIILSLGLAAASTLLGSSFSSASNTSGRAKTEEQTNRFLTILGTDVRQAMAPARGDSSANRDVLRQWLREGTLDDNALADIPKATTTELWLRTDALADANAGVECVGYVEGPNGMERKVFADASPCPATAGTPVETQRLLPPRPAEFAGRPIFTYVLSVNNDIYGAAPVDIANCTTTRGVRLTASASSANLGSIVGVIADASNWENGGASGFAASSSYAVQSRQNATYKAALGCAY